MLRAVIKYYENKLDNIILYIETSDDGKDGIVKPYNFKMGDDITAPKLAALFTQDKPNVDGLIERGKILSQYIGQNIQKILGLKVDDLIDMVISGVNIYIPLVYIVYTITNLKTQQTIDKLVIYDNVNIMDDISLSAFVTSEIDRFKSLDNTIVLIEDLKNNETDLISLAEQQKLKGK